MLLRDYNMKRSTVPLTCTKLIAVDRLGSGEWVSASFQMFALTAGWNGLGGEGIIQEGELSGAEYIRGGNACTPLLQVVRAAWNLVY